MTLVAVVAPLPCFLTLCEAFLVSAVHKRQVVFQLTRMSRDVSKTLRKGHCAVSFSLDAQSIQMFTEQRAQVKMFLNCCAWL